MSPKVLEQSEVICIIRPVNQPRGGSRVVIINRASRKFMAYLTGEMKDQLLPAMGHSPAGARESDTSMTANATSRERRGDGHTAVWKQGRDAADHIRLEADPPAGKRRVDSHGGWPAALALGSPGTHEKPPKKRGLPRRLSDPAAPAPQPRRPVYSPASLRLRHPLRSRADLR